MKRGLLTMILLCILGVVVVGAQEGGDDVSQFAGNPEFPAPDFPTGLDWLNVPAPLTMTDLRGKVIILDFWTYGCINCIHMIPVLHQLEEKYANELVVIGVHSAKFENEGQTENIRQIVQRYELVHPVINDSDFAVWNTYRPYGVNAWPSFAVIDPVGNLFAVDAGEIPFEAFDRVIAGMVANFDTQNVLNREPIEIVLEADRNPSTALSFPGKVLVDEAGGRLFIADSSHNRIIVTDLNSYEVLDVVGNSSIGLNDGSYADATFDKPQGMALRDDILYVADVNNHAIRAIDLAAQTVSTIAGTGRQGRSLPDTVIATAMDLRSPWDVEFGDGDMLYVAMAGTHQIWMMNVADGTLVPFIGSGREGLFDGSFEIAQLAQPSGLFYQDGMLYFADSESSSIRVAEIEARQVRTLAGPASGPQPEGRLLFEFGDADGVVGTSRLQHALGVAAAPDGTLYVTDTYNSKIKQIDVPTSTISTLFGEGGLGGFRDGGIADATFDEPGGLDYASGRLYVADTNNHAIRVIDLDANTVSTVVFPNPDVLQIEGQATVVGGNAALGEVVILEEQTVSPGSREIVLNIVLPEGYKLNALAPFTARWASSGDSVRIAEGAAVISMPEPELPVRVQVALSEGSAMVTGDLTIYYCEAIQESLCYIDQVHIEAPVVVAEGGSETVNVERVITPPEITAGGL